MCLRLSSPQQQRLSRSRAGVFEWEKVRFCSCFSTERRWLSCKETLFSFALQIISPQWYSCLQACSPIPLHGSRRPSAGRGKADAVVAPVEFGVVVSDEAGAQDPEGTSWRWDVQPRESHHADVLPVLGLLQRGGDPRGDGAARREIPTPACLRKGCDPQQNTLCLASTFLPLGRWIPACLCFFLLTPNLPKTTQGSSDRLVWLIWKPLPNRRVWGRIRNITLGLISAALGEPRRVQDTAEDLHPEMHCSPQQIHPAWGEPPSRPSRRDAAYPEDIG